jgi:Flavodoxin-like fold
MSGDNLHRLHSGFRVRLRRPGMTPSRGPSPRQRFAILLLTAGRSLFKKPVAFCAARTDLRDCALIGFQRGRMPKQKKILILFAHPRLSSSVVQRAMLRAVDGLENVTFHDLYAAYPDFIIDVKREQELLLSHDIIVFQHPFYWYSSPAIIKVEAAPEDHDERRLDRRQQGRLSQERPQPV